MPVCVKRLNVVSVLPYVSIFSHHQGILMTVGLFQTGGGVR